MINPIKDKNNKNILPGKLDALKVIAKQQNENKTPVNIEKPILLDEKFIALLCLMGLCKVILFMIENEKIK